jgi:hypothetical protein
LGRGFASACDVAIMVTADTVATAAVPATNDVGTRKSVAAPSAVERSNAGKYDMAVLQLVLIDGNFVEDAGDPSGIGDRVPARVRLWPATTS